MTGIELSLIAGFRSVNVGWDSADYYNIFYSNGSRIDMELGFLWYVRWIAKFFDSHISLFLITAFFIVFSNMRFIYKYSAMPLLSVLMYISAIPFGQYHLVLSLLRQGLAISIFLFAFDSILKRKPLRFIILVFIAMLFHKSALLCLLLYPLAKIKFNFKYATPSVVLIGVIIFLFPQVLYQIVSNLSYGGYSSWIMYNTDYIGILIKMFLSLFLFVLFYICGYNKLKSSIIFNTLCWALFLSFVNELISQKIYFFTRCSFYFSCFYIIAFPYVINIIEDKKNRIILVFAVLFMLVFNNIEFFINRAEKVHLRNYESYFTNPSGSVTYLRGGLNLGILRS
jgi:hypothetical protein